VIKDLKAGSGWGVCDSAEFYQQVSRENDLILAIADLNSLVKINKGEGILNMEVVALSTLKISLRDLLFNE